MCFVLCSTFAVGCYDVVFKNPQKKVQNFCEIFVEFLLLLFFVEVVFW
jgi:hypothetical protein